MSIDVATLSMDAASRAIQKRAVSVTELLDAYLQRIAAIDTSLGAYVTVMRGHARMTARRLDTELDSGRWRGPLHGIPVAIKDLVAIGGEPTTAGSRVLANFVPDSDAPVVTRLRDAGAVILGKATTHEFAADVKCPPTRNPWDLTRIPGGSSGGSAAAVAADLCLAAVGTDTSGSIRIPAALCGVSGLKPTHGRVSTEKVIPFSWSLDHVGPLAREARDLLVLLRGMAASGEDLEARNGEFDDGRDDGVCGLRVGRPSTYFFDRLAPPVARAIEESIETIAALGASVKPVETVCVEHSVAAGDVLTFAEASLYHRPWIEKHRELYQTATLANLHAGAVILATDYLQAQRVRDQITRGLVDALRSVDVLVAPTTPLQAIAADSTTASIGGDEERPLDAYGRLTYPASLAGLPAVSIPCGFADGLPIGLQIIGRPREEKRILGVAHAYQQTTDWHLKRPPTPFAREGEQLAPSLAQE